MPLLKDQFYDAVIVPEKCGFFRQNKKDGIGKLYLKVMLSCVEGEYPYVYWVSGGMIDSIKRDLPQMGVDPSMLSDREFYKNASKYIQAVQCRFGVKEETYNEKTVLKISGIFFGDGGSKASDDDADELVRKLGAPTGSVIDDDEAPF